MKVWSIFRIRDWQGPNQTYFDGGELPLEGFPKTGDGILLDGEPYVIVSWFQYPITYLNSAGSVINNLGSVHVVETAQFENAMRENPYLQV